MDSDLGDLQVHCISGSALLRPARQRCQPGAPLLRPPSRRRLLLRTYPKPQRAPHVPCITRELASCISSQMFDVPTIERALHSETQTSDAHIDGTQQASDEDPGANKTYRRTHKRDAHTSRDQGALKIMQQMSPRPRSKKYRPVPVQPTPQRRSRGANWGHARGERFVRR